MNWIEQYAAILDPLISGRRDVLAELLVNTLRYIEQRMEVDGVAASHGFGDPLIADAIAVYLGLK